MFHCLFGIFARAPLFSILYGPTSLVNELRALQKWIKLWFPVILLGASAITSPSECQRRNHCRHLSPDLSQMHLPLNSKSTSSQCHKWFNRLRNGRCSRLVEAWTRALLARNSPGKASRSSFHVTRIHARPIAVARLRRIVFQWFAAWTWRHNACALVCWLSLSRDAGNDPRS